MDGRAGQDASLAREFEPKELLPSTAEQRRSSDQNIKDRRIFNDSFSKALVLPDTSGTSWYCWSFKLLTAFIANDVILRSPYTRGISVSVTTRIPTQIVAIRRMVLVVGNPESCATMLLLRGRSGDSVGKKGS